MPADTNMATADALIALVHDVFGPSPIPLHRPVFEGNERAYLTDTIDSNFVSSVGPRVIEFEEQIAAFTGAARAIATVNGTAALHIALLVAGVRAGDEVISQALTFVATCNAISYVGAKPVFVDVDADTMGMSPVALREWLEAHTQRVGETNINRKTGARIAACVPMRTFGYNYRLPNLNAALGCAQMERLPAMLRIKTDVAARYRAFCAEYGLHFIDPIPGTTANYWLNAVLSKDRCERDAFLEYTNARGVMTRPIWRLMNELPAFADCENNGLETSIWLADRVVNLPSSVPDAEFHRLKS